MQRRKTQRPPANQQSLPSSSLVGQRNTVAIHDKYEKRKSNLLYALLMVGFAVLCIGKLLTPSQKSELIEAEHHVEDWLRNRPDSGVRKAKPQQRQTNPKVPEQSQAVPKPEEPKKESKPDTTKIEAKTESKQDANPADGFNSRWTPDEISEASKEGLSIGWVEREKLLKQKLQVLYDRHQQQQNLAVPVLTRYLGEDIPAYVGTPDSTMKEEEWKKMVDEKYKQMRLEEEEWQKKMTLMISKRERDMGITTP